MAMNVTSDDPTLFTPPAEQRATSEIVFLTNRHNLLEILASGVIAPRESYAKYYDDLLALAPGRIPLLRAPVGAEACHMVTAGEETAFPVALELDVRRLAGGTFPALGAEGGTAGLADAHSLAWAPVGAIPLSAVTRVHFRSEAERREHERRQYENVPALPVPVETSPRLFDGGSLRADDLRQWFAAITPAKTPSRADYERADRVAGALCLMVASAPARPDVFASLAALLSGPAPGAPAPKKRGRKEKETSPRGAGLSEWLVGLWSADGMVQASLEGRLFGSAIRVLSGITRSTSWRPVEVLSAVDADVRAGKLAKAEEAEISRTVEHIRAILRNERDMKPFRSDSGLDVAKALLMVLLRPEPTRLLAWPRAELAATDSVWTTAAALAGALSGFKRLPISVRGDSLHGFLPERAALQLPQGGASAWPPPDAAPLSVEVVQDEGLLTLSAEGRVLVSREQEPPTLAQLVGRLDVTLNEVVQRVVDMCRVLGWADCVSTIVTLGSSEFTVRAERRGSAVSVHASGWPEVVTQLNGERFKERLEGEGIAAEHKERVRTLLADFLLQSQAGARNVERQGSGGTAP